MPSTIFRVGFPGIELLLSNRQTGQTVNRDVIGMFFNMNAFSEEQRQALCALPDFKTEVKLTWTIREHDEHAPQRLAPPEEDVRKLAANLQVPKFLARYEAKHGRQPPLEQIQEAQLWAARRKTMQTGGYQLAGLPRGVVNWIRERRMDVVILGERYESREEKRGVQKLDPKNPAALRRRYIDINDLLELRRSSSVKTVTMGDRIRRDGTLYRTSRVGPDEYLNAAYVEEATFEKQGLIVVIPSFVVAQLARLKFMSIVWTQSAFLDAIKAVDAHFENQGKPLINNTLEDDD